MKLIRNFFLVFIIYAFCSACKSSKMAYDFPSVGEKKGLREFSDRLSEKWTLVYKIFLHVLVAVFSMVLLQYAWKYALIGKRQTSPAMGLKMSWIFGSTFIFFVLVSLSTVLLALKDSLTLIEKRGE